MITGIIPKYFNILTAIIFLFFVPFNSYSQIDHSNQPVEEDPHSSSSNKSEDTKHQHLIDFIPETSKLSRKIGVREKLGAHIMLKSQFIDSDGKAIQLNNLITKPVLILPVFFFCSQSCNIMLSNLANAIPDVPYELGKDYQVIAFSFNDKEGPDIAKKAKSDYLSRLESLSGQPDNRLSSDISPADSWTFLVGNRTAIHDLTESLGFRFRKTGTHSFVHPNVLIVCDQNGKIIRYLYGVHFLPFD
ncbi:MAG: SCO family protein, partial [Candidatus Heimdallarchaeota archaeon]|nr:SCO family protein [Candidatus Heimdallarchaeota archaeon]